MEKSSEDQNNNTMVEALSKLIEDPLTDDNDKVKYIYKRIYINYEKKNWSNVIEDINMYQQITKSKKLNLLKFKTEFQQNCRKSRTILMELTDSDIDDNDEHEQLVSTLSPTNVDDFINGRLKNKSNKKQKK